MDYDDLMEHYPTLKAVADALGLKHRQTVHKWKVAGVPIEWQIAAELATDGKLKADLPRRIRNSGNGKRRAA